MTLAVLFAAQPVFALSAGATADLGVRLGDGAAPAAASQAAVQASGMGAAGPSIYSGSDQVSGEAGARIEADLRAAAAVSGDDDLKRYAEGVKQRDADVASIDPSGNAVVVKHKVKARAFGIFPVTVLATAKIASDGSIAVNYPWYAFAFGQASWLHDRIAAAIHLHSIAGSSSFDAATKARVIAAATVAMDTVAEAETGTTAH